jgi:hypothetical protein
VFRLPLFLSLLLFPVVALAQAVVPDPTADLAAFLSLAGQLWAGARWAPLIALVVVAIVALLRTYGTGLVPWFGTKLGGLTLAVGTAVAGAVAQALLVPGPVVWAQVVVTALLAAVGAVGVHSGTKNTSQAVRKAKAPAAALERTGGAAALLVILVALPFASGCAALRANQNDLACGIRDGCVVCSGELVQDGVSRAVEVRYCEGAEPVTAPATAAVAQ